jgi:hypothetical protein
VRLDLNVTLYANIDRHLTIFRVPYDSDVKNTKIKILIVFGIMMKQCYRKEHVNLMFW